MKPLHVVALGYLVTLFYARVDGGWDVVPDPLGWLLVGLGAARLPDVVRQRGAVVAAAVVAGLVSLPLVLPPVYDAVAGADTSLGWAASLPGIAVSVLLAHGLAGAARSAGAGGGPGDETAARWLLALRGTLVVVAVLPALIYGLGQTWLATTAALLFPLSVLWLLWLLFSYASRPWAGGAAAAA